MIGRAWAPLLLALGASCASDSTEKSPGGDGAMLTFENRGRPFFGPVLEVYTYKNLQDCTDRVQLHADSGVRPDAPVRITIAAGAEFTFALRSVTGHNRLIESCSGAFAFTPIAGRRYVVRSRPENGACSLAILEEIRDTKGYKNYDHVRDVRKRPECR